MGDISDDLAIAIQRGGRGKVKYEILYIFVRKGLFKVRYATRISDARVSRGVICIRNVLRV